MVGKAGRSGRRPGLNPKRHPLRTRVDAGLYSVFKEMHEEEAVRLPRGIEFTEAEFLRLLIIEGAERRGKQLPPDARFPRAATAPEPPPPKPSSPRAKRTKR